MKSKMNKLWASLLAGAMAFSFTACDFSGVNPPDDGETEYSYLSIDINPSIELMVNGETVVGVKACNEDAAILLSGENFENMQVDVVTEKIVALAEELGYLTDENNDVKIIVTADSDEIVSAIEKLAKEGMGKGSELAKFNHTPRVSDERQVKKLKDENPEKYKDLTAGKLRLIETIMEYDETMTYEIGVTMSIGELTELLDKLVDEFEGIVGEELEEMFKAKFEEIKLEYETRIAELFGEEYQEYWERYVALERVAKAIEKTAKNVKISAEDAEKLMGIMGIEPEITEQPEQPEQPDQPVPPQGPNGDRGGKDCKPTLDDKGQWAFDDFEKFFDRHDDCCFDDDKYEDLFDEVDDVLKGYDEESYVLTQDDLTAIETAWGEAIEVTTYGDLEEFLEDVEDELEEMREKTELTGVGALLIEPWEEFLKTAKESAKNFLNGHIEQMKESYQTKKEELRGQKK